MDSMGLIFGTVLQTVDIGRNPVQNYSRMQIYQTVGEFLLSRNFPRRPDPTLECYRPLDRQSRYDQISTGWNGYPAPTLAHRHTQAGIHTMGSRMDPTHIYRFLRPRWDLSSYIPHKSTTGGFLQVKNLIGRRKKYITSADMAANVRDRQVLFYNAIKPGETARNHSQKTSLFQQLVKELGICRG